MQKLRLTAMVLALCIVAAMFVGVVAAEDPPPGEDPVFFVIGDGSTYSGGEGWYAGYVIADESGVYTLQISANGPEKRFPVTDVKVIVCISDEAASTATVVIGSDTPTPYLVTSYTQTNPSYYPPGGVFSEPDYYGYNDAYVIPELTYAQTHHPDYSYPLQVAVNFLPSATLESKVMFLCYGTDSAGDPAKTPFSGGTLITPVPEYWLAPVGFAACFAGFCVYRKICSTR